MESGSGLAMRAAEGAFVMTRRVDAPRARVWRAFTEQERLARWFGPAGFAVSACSLELRPGGTFHYCMRSPDGVELWGKWVFREIAAPGELVVVVSFSDPQGGVARHPMNAAWPLETLSTITLADHGDATAITVRWVAINATDEERRSFDEQRDAIHAGWSGTFAKLDSFLAAPAEA